jgi:hypothetical protein
LALFAGAVSGQIAALVAWLVTCQAYYGTIDIDTLGGDYPMLAGNVCALGVSAIVTTIFSFAMPENFDWDIMRNGIEMVEQDGTDKLDDGRDSTRIRALSAPQPLLALLHRCWHHKQQFKSNHVHSGWNTYTNLCLDGDVLAMHDATGDDMPCCG